MFAIAFAIGSLTVYYNTRFAGRIVRALIGIDAVAPEAAMTLEDLGIKPDPVMRFALRKGSSLSEIVLKTGDGRYYINSEKLTMAKRKYRDEHISAVFLLLLMFIVCVFALACTYIFPEILEFVETKWNEIFN